MLDSKPNVRSQGAIILGDRTLHLYLPEGDQQALLQLGIEAEDPGGLPEVAARGGEGVHGDRGRQRNPSAKERWRRLW